MLAIVQPAAQDYLVFEAEDPQATITDLDGDGITWKRVSGSTVNGATTAPVGGAIKSFRNAAETGNNEGQISYPVQLRSAGPYFIYARTFYRNLDGDNSMYLPANGGPIDAQPSQQWDNNNINFEYHWNLTDNAATPFSFTNPTPNVPTSLKFNIREHLYVVDRVVLSEREMTEDELNALTPQTVRITPALYPDLNGVTLTYDAVAGATGYNILRGTSEAGPFTAVTGGTNVTDTTFTDDSLPAGSTGQTFYYVVEAITPTGNVQSVPESYVAGSGLIATHYETEFFQDNPLSEEDPHVRTDNTLDENWGSNGPDFLAADPSATDPDDTWSIIFNGRLRAPVTGDYTFHTASDDGIDIQIVDPDTGNVLLEGPAGGINFLRGIAYPFQDTVGTVNLTAGKFYNFRVRWTENGGGAAWRVGWRYPGQGFQPIPNDVLFRPDTSTVPLSPTNLAARPRADGAFVTWTDRANNETGYLLERKTGSGAFTQIADLPAETASYTDTGLAAGTVVTYRVRAKNDAGNSAYSNEGTATVGGGGGTGLLAKVYDTRFFTDNPDDTDDPHIDHDLNLDTNWGSGGPAYLVSDTEDPTLTAATDTWSVVWTGQVLPEFSENYTFYTGSDDGIELTITDPATGQVILDGPPGGIQFLRGIAYPYQDVVGTVPLQAGKKYDIQVRFSENGGGAAYRVAWSSPSIPVEPIPDLQLFESTGTENVRPAQLLSADVVCSDRITVSWADASLAETGSVLQRSDSATGPWTDVLTLGPDQNTQFTDTGPFTVDTNYYYRVVTNGPGGPVNSQPLTAHTYNGSTVTDTKLKLNGTAKYITVPTTTDPDGQALQLTDNVNSQAGTAFLTQARDFNHDWSSTFDFQIPEHSGNRADGFTFTIQSNSPSVVGGGGGSLGSAGIPNSFTVKFDIYNAINQTGVYLNGRMADDGQDIGFDIANGHKYHVTLTYDADYADGGGDDDAIDVKIEDVTDPTVVPFDMLFTGDTLGATFDMDQILGGGCGYVGFTGATGGENAEQNILDWSIDNDGPAGPGAPQEIPLVAPIPETAARVTKVFVNGTNLTANAAWRNAAGADPTFGYPIPDGANQLRPVPWTQGINKVSIQFDTDVSTVLDQGDLVVNGSGGPIGVTGFTYDAPTKTGTWTLASTVTLDKLRLVLDDAGFGTVGLNGEWVNPSTATPAGDTFPSGDATPGGDFNFRINVLRGDANGDSVVNALDVADIKKRLTRRPGDGVTGPNAYSIFADLNADGVVNALDVAAVKARLGNRLTTLPDPATALLFA